MRAPVKAALRLIVRFVDAPDDLGAADFAELRGLGVSERAIEDVLQVSAVFQVITRIADALEFDIPDWRSFKRAGKLLLARGYA